MAKVKIEEIIDDLGSEIKKALEDAVRRTIPNAVFDRNILFREFKRAVGRKCRAWERVSDRHIDID